MERRKKGREGGRTGERKGGREGASGGKRREGEGFRREEV